MKAHGAVVNIRFTIKTRKNCLLNSISLKTSLLNSLEVCLLHQTLCRPKRFKRQTAGAFFNNGDLYRIDCPVL